MTIKEIVMLAVLGAVIVAGIISIVVALVRGDMKKFIEEKMIEAEKSGKSGSEKLAYVISAVKEKYKIVELILNIRKFVEHIISISKQINCKEEEGKWRKLDTAFQTRCMKLKTITLKIYHKSC